MDVIIFLFINIVVVSFIGILIYILTSKKAYENKEYFVYATKSMIISIPALILFNLILISLLNLSFSIFFVVSMIIFIPLIVLFPILLDYCYGDIVNDYYLVTKNKTLLGYHKYKNIKDSLGSVKRILSQNGIFATSIEKYTQSKNVNTRFYYVNNKYYILLSEDCSMILNKIDSRDILDKYIEKIQSEHECKKLIERIDSPFKSKLYFEYINHQICEVNIIFFQENEKIYVKSEKIIKTSSK